MSVCVGIFFFLGGGGGAGIKEGIELYWNMKRGGGKIVDMCVGGKGGGGSRR